MTRTLQLGQTYPTRDGKGTGRVVALGLDMPRTCAVVLSFGESKQVIAYTATGRFYSDDVEDCYDLIIPERKMRTVYAHILKEPVPGGLWGWLYEEECRLGYNTFPAYPVEVPAE